MTVSLCFEDHVITTCGQGQGFATSEAMIQTLSNFKIFQNGNTVGRRRLYFFEKPETF